MSDDMKFCNCDVCGNHGLHGQLFKSYIMTHEGIEFICDDCARVAKEASELNYGLKQQWQFDIHKSTLLARRSRIQRAKLVANNRAKRFSKFMAELDKLKIWKK